MSSHEKTWSLLICLILCVCLPVKSATTTKRPIQPCPYQTCKCSLFDYFRVDCSGLNINHLPPLKPVSVNATAIFDISDTKITSIGDRQAPNDIDRIISTDTPLKTISFNAFYGSRNTLWKIYIRNSSLTLIPYGVKYMKKLTDMDITYSQLTNIHPIFAMNGTGLEYMNFESNKICGHGHIYESLIPHQKTLRDFRLKHNCLHNIPDLSHLENLFFLDLSNNSVTNPNSGHIPATLGYFYMTDNNLSGVPNAVASMSRLRTMELANNKIKSIDNAVFPSKLIYFNLRDNDIQTISTLKFVNNTASLKTLLLANNPIRSIASNVFNNVPELYWLELKNTHLARLPLALLKLSSISILSMADNKDLVCTCTESSLGPWYKALSRVSLSGKCDGADIKYFLETLAPQCPPKGR